MLRINWQKLFEKKQTDPIKQTKSDLYFYALVSGQMALVLGLLIMVSGNKEVLEAIGVELFSRITIALMLCLLVLYAANIPTLYFKLKKLRAESKG